MKKLSNRIWIIIIVFLTLTVLFMYVLTDFLYEQLYVRDTELSMVEVGKNLKTMYKGGPVTDEFVDHVETYNTYSDLNVFAVRNPRELSACVPFDIDYHTLIGAEERDTLLTGKPVTKMGYEERFDRQIISVIIPLTDQNRLEGILYLYFPLAKISELASKEVILLLGSAALFLVLMGFGVYKGIGRIMRPLNELQHAAEEMASGNYTTRVHVSSTDEIGRLAETFNTMASAIQKEDEAQKTFLATVSHELRTPISYVKGYGEAMQNGFISEKEQTETINLIVREANRMEKLTNELMQLVRASNEAEPIELYPLPLAETLREVQLLLEPLADKKKITLTSEMDEEIIIEANEEKLKQILINILENAIYYSDEMKEVQMTSTIVDNMAVIEIKDQGIGIPQEDLPHITERFYRVNKARSRKDGGSGLGLSIVKQLVQDHHGTLSVQSELGEGTTVVVQIPLMEE